MGTLIDLTGQRFGRLRVIREANRTQDNRATWLCVCDCGREKTVRGDGLRNGNTRSCGCLVREAVARRCRIHGMRREPEYCSWAGMIQRCTNPNDDRFKDYGGRGIKVCDRWLHSFENFYADMGKRPTPQHSLDRIDVNGNYEPSNCRWATTKEQRNNRRDSRRSEARRSVPSRLLTPILSLMLTACAGDDVAQRTYPHTATPTPQPTATATALPQPTPTPAPTETPDLAPPEPQPLAIVLPTVRGAPLPTAQPVPTATPFIPDMQPCPVNEATGRIDAACAATWRQP